MPDYKVLIADLSSRVIDEVPAKNLQYTGTLNAAGNVNFTLPRFDKRSNTSILAVGEREIHVYRDDLRVWGGYLWTANSGGEGNVIRFGGSGWKSRLDRRYIAQTLQFNGVDQLDIAWDLIDYTQTRGQDLGIRRGSTEKSGVLRDRTFYFFERKNVGESLEQLASVRDGFDFEITPNKRWVTYYPQKSKATNTVFATGKNIRGHSVEYDATHVRSRITAFGEGEAEAMLIYEHTDEETEARYGLLEGTVSFKDVRLMSTLREHAEEEQFVVRRHFLQPQLALQVDIDTPPVGFSVGDICRVKIDDGYDQIDDMFRIISKVVAISQAGTEVSTVFFERAR